MPRERTKELSKRQKAIYNFIRRYSAKHGYPPSVREIGTAVGLASPSTVHMHLKVLEDRGYIRRSPNKSRTIEIVADDSKRKAAGAGSTDGLGAGTITLPLVGRVAAGTPILAEQNIEEHLTLPSSVVGDASSFVLRVRGDSMINAGIFDGDFIVVKEQADAEDGQIVVALLDDSATVKTFYRESDRIRLQPENDTMEPIYSNDPQIVGLVTALIRTVA